MPINHRHRVIRAEIRPYGGPVATPGNPTARGGVTETQRCECGAVRRVNVNGRAEEVGPWVESRLPER